MPDLQSQLQFLMNRNLLKYEYYNGTHKVRVFRRQGASEQSLYAEQTTGLVKARVDSFRNRISPVYIRGKADVTQHLTNSIMSQCFPRLRG